MQTPHWAVSLLASHQAAVMWFWLLLGLAIAAVVLFTVSSSHANSSFSVVQTLPNAPMLQSMQRSTLINAADLFSQMRVSSPVFNSWLTLSSSNVLLYDDDPDTDIIYHLATKQLDIVPGSVVTLFPTSSVLSPAPGHPPHIRRPRHQLHHRRHALQ